MTYFQPARRDIERQRRRERRAEALANAVASFLNAMLAAAVLASFHAPTWAWLGFSFVIYNLWLLLLRGSR